MVPEMTKYYQKFSDFLVQKYGQKVWKISLDAGLSCPNCDSDGKEGCIFCRNDSFSPMGTSEYKSITRQMQGGIAFAQKRWGIKKYIAYFQSSTNTFAPVNELERLYHEAIAQKDVVAISIATRPDCLPPKVIDLIQSLTSKVDVWIELGLQSSFDDTLKIINRGHTFQDYKNAVEALKKINVRICTHIMIGLPGESRTHIKKTAQRISSNGTHEVKIHPLLILKGTPLESMHQQGRIAPLSMDEYVSLAVDFVEMLPPDMVIQRLTAESQKDLLIEPQWCTNKLRVLSAIDAEFEKRGSRQGECYKTA